MSVLTDLLDACIPHTPHCGDACYCGTARRKVAEEQAAVVAEWLGTLDADPYSGDSLGYAADEAVKGVDA